MSQVVMGREIPSGRSLTTSSDVSFVKVPRNYVVVCRDGVAICGDGEKWSVYPPHSIVRLPEEIWAIAVR